MFFVSLQIISLGFPPLRLAFRYYCGFSLLLCLLGCIAPTIVEPVSYTL